MNQYFFKITKEEKNDILEQHKSIYDGYVTNYIQPKETPLYVQDFANDKNGVTLSNKNKITGYKNTGINEDVYSGSHGFEPEESFEEEEEYISLGEIHDMIGDGDDDLEQGTFDYEDQHLIQPETDLDMDDELFDDDEDDLLVQPQTDLDYEDYLFEGHNFDDNQKGEIANQILETLNVFNRIKRFN